jgi:hypothetical protein
MSEEWNNLGNDRWQTLEKNVELVG